MKIRNKSRKERKMKNNEWAKTILIVYKYLERVTDGIDKLVNQNALNSFYYRGENMGENDVVVVADRIIKLCERKAKLVNIKVLVDRCLTLVDKNTARILIERYIDEDEADEIAKRHNLSKRTYFRHLFQAELRFYQAMSRLGFNGEKLSTYLAEEKWILEIYDKMVDDESEVA